MCLEVVKTDLGSEGGLNLNWVENSENGRKLRNGGVGGWQASEERSRGGGVTEEETGGKLSGF